MAGGKGTTKTTCRKCNRTVYVVATSEGPVETDPELIRVIRFEGSSEVILARRVHGEMCLTYVTQAERLKAAQERKRAANPGAKRAPNGRREPGQ